MKTEKFVRLTGDPDHPIDQIAVTPLGGDRYRIEIEGEELEVEGFETDHGIALRIGDRSLDLSVERRGDIDIVRGPGGRFDFEMVDDRTYHMKNALGAGAGGMKPELRSPMTGKVVLVRCAVGDAVEEGQTLIIVEAMKMENEIKAEGAAVVMAVKVAPGDLVSPGDVLIEFEIG